MLNSQAEPRFRASFLRADATRISTSISEILSFEHLINEVEIESGQSDELRKLLAMEHFFHGFPDTAFQSPHATYPEMGLYEPVEVREVKTRQKWRDLSSLISALRSSHASEGIFLSSATGSGKTVAGIKAMLDCAPGRALEGYLPCRIDNSVPVSSSTTFYDLLPCKAPEFPDQLERDSRIDKWLEAGSPLLIFCDLNSFPPDQARYIAKILVGFQAEPKWQSCGHLCVVTYRSSRRDEVRDILKGNSQDKPIFREYDLAPLTLPFAERYLQNFRRIEGWVREKFGLPAKERDSDAEAQKLRELSKSAESEGQSIIRTPLLMHFVSLLEGEGLARVTSVATLYDEVVDQLLARNVSKYSGRSTIVSQADGTGVNAMKSLMTRIALAMLPNGTRLSLSKSPTFSGVTLSPEDFDDRDFWPKATSESRWKNCPYYRNVDTVFSDEKGNRKLSADTLPDIGEFSLMRVEGDSQLAFLHDSLLYYFASQALWQPTGPESVARQDDETWLNGVADCMSLNPDAWLVPGKFLNQRIECNSRLELAWRLVAADSKRGLTELAMEFCSPRTSDSDKVDNEIALPLGAIRSAITRYGSWCYEDESRLFGQVCNELKWRKDKNQRCSDIANSLISRKNKTSHIWMRATSGFDAPTKRIMSSPPNERCEAVAKLDDTQVLCGFASGRLCIWNHDSGRVVEAGSCGSMIKSLTVVSPTMFLVATWDQIHLFNIQSGITPVSTFDPEIGRIGTMALSGTESLGVVGSDGIGVLNLSSSAYAKYEVTGSCCEGFTVLPDGRFVGSHDYGHVIAWDSCLIDKGPIELANLRKVAGTSVQVEGLVPFGKSHLAVTFWTGFTRILGIWDYSVPGTVDFIRSRHEGNLLAKYDATHALIGIRPQGWYLWDTKADRIMKISDGYGGEAEVIDPKRIVIPYGDDAQIHEIPDGDWKEVAEKNSTESVDSVQFMPNGTLAARSCSNERVFTIRRVESSLSQTEVMRREGPKASVIECLGDGTVALGTSDGRIRLWNPERNSLRTIGQARGAVQALAVTPNKTLISMDHEGYLLEWTTSISGSLGKRIWKHVAGTLDLPFVFSSPLKEVGWYGDGYRIGGLTVLGGRFVICSGQRSDFGNHEKYVSKRESDRTSGGIYAWDAMSGGCKPIGYRSISGHAYAPSLASSTRWLGNHGDDVSAMAITQDDRIVTAGGRSIYLWDPYEPGKPTKEIGQQSYVGSLASLCNGWIISGAQDGTIKGWDLDCGPVFAIQTGVSIQSIAAALDSPRIAAGTREGKILFFDVENLA